MSETRQIESTTFVQLTATVQLDPLHVARFRELLRPLATRAREDSEILRYEVTRDLNDEATYHFLEQYRNQKALEDHQARQECAAYIEELPTLIIHPVVVTIGEVTIAATCTVDPVSTGQCHERPA